MVTSPAVGDPVALVVEDQRDSRETRVDLLKAHGFTVFSAESAESAFRELHSIPSIDMVVTDVNLKPGSSSDRSGVSLARSIRTEDPKILIMGYSAVFSEGDLGSHDLKVFDDYLLKGYSTLEELDGRVLDWKSRAVETRKERVASAAAELDRLRSKYHAPRPDFARLLLLQPASDEGLAAPEEPSPEEILSKAGYRLRIIESGTSRPVLSSASGKIVSPLIVWLKSKDDIVVAEVYGYPSLYGFGDTEDEAVTQVLLLMDGFHKELVVEAPKNEALSSPMRRLRDFLKHVLG